MNERQMRSSPTSQHSLRALVVEDREDVAMSLAMLLERLGYSVQVAPTAKEALEHGAHFKPEVIFLDIGLPDQSGYDVCKDMRRSEWASKAFIVALTGRNEPSDMIRSANTGFDRHVAKPMGFDTLQEILLIVNDRAA